MGRGSIGWWGGCHIYESKYDTSLPYCLLTCGFPISGHRALYLHLTKANAAEYSINYGCVVE